jgi:hypothetical protein
LQYHGDPFAVPLEEQLMTPEEQQRMMDFILESHASSVVRMDRLEQNQKRHEENQLRFEEDHRKFGESMAQLRDEGKQQKERVDALLLVSERLLKITGRLGDRTQKLESRADSADETLKVLRELLEANLRRPDNPLR